MRFMNMLKESSKRIIDRIKELVDNWECFERVYLFGSVLRLDDSYNDIDILLIYEEYSSEIGQQREKIKNELERICRAPVDLTALSREEENDVKFLDRLKSNYLRLK